MEAEIHCTISYKSVKLSLAIVKSVVVCAQALDDWIFYLFIIFFLHFHPFGDPNDMFMKLFYL